ncbi:unnamed protein product [Ixodes pacificus]
MQSIAAPAFGQKAILISGILIDGAANQPRSLSTHFLSHRITSDIRLSAGAFFVWLCLAASDSVCDSTVSGASNQHSLSFSKARKPFQMLDKFSKGSMFADPLPHPIGCPVVLRRHPWRFGGPSPAGVCDTAVCCATFSETLDDLKEKLQFRSSGNKPDSWPVSFFRDLTKASPAKQLTVGGVSGWCVGFVFTKAGKVAATAIGGSLLLFQVGTPS